MATDFQIRLACQQLKAGRVIAYPTEGVWGLGCDPWQETAVMKLLALKQRSVTKGLILIASDIKMLTPFFSLLNKEEYQLLKAHWPGPLTWLIPIDPLKIPYWLRGDFTTLAVRVSNHPTVKQLCDAFGGPIVSTSANLTGRPAATSILQVQRVFGNQIAYYLSGKLITPGKPSTIRDLRTQQIVRA